MENSEKISAMQSWTVTSPERNDRIHPVPVAILPMAMNLPGEIERQNIERVKLIWHIFLMSR